MCPLLRTRLDKLNEQQREVDDMELRLVKAVEAAVVKRCSPAVQLDLALNTSINTPSNK
jgi:hypothetical protein